MKLAHLCVFIASVAAGVCWALERDSTSRLKVRLEELRRQSNDFARLRVENSRLLQLQTSIDVRNGSRARLGSDAPEETEGTASSESPDRAQSLQIGRWASSSEWTDCGRATPEATVETMLCAARHGDLGSLKDALVFDEGALAKARSILDDLPEASRGQYGSPEDVLAMIVGGNVSLDSVRLVAQQRNSANEVTEYIRVRNADGVTHQVVMALHRGESGWRLFVPAPAVDLFGVVAQ